MKRFILFSFLVASVLWMGGCALTQDQKSNLEKVLKQQVDSFVDNSVQGKWDAVYALTTGSFGAADKLRENLKKTLPDNSALTGGDIASMAWEDDSTAKVKINWAFRLANNSTGFSSETYVWVLKGSNWKYKGRALR
jgi:hypothetical protein